MSSATEATGGESSTPAAAPVPERQRRKWLRGGLLRGWRQQVFDNAMLYKDITQWLRNRYRASPRLIQQSDRHRSATP